MVARRHPQARVAVHHARLPCRHRHIGQHPGPQARTHRRAVDRRDDGLLAMHELVDQVARLAAHAAARLGIAREVFHHGQVAPAGEALPLAAQHLGDS